MPTENITQNCPNNDPCNNNSNTREAMSETTKNISIPSDLTGNVIGKNGYRVQQIQTPTMWRFIQNFKTEIYKT